MYIILVTCYTTLCLPLCISNLLVPFIFLSEDGLYWSEVQEHKTVTYSCIPGLLNPAYRALPRPQFYLHDVQVKLCQIHVKKLLQSLVSVCVPYVNIEHNVIHFMYMTILLSLFQSNVEGEEEKGET